MPFVAAFVALPPPLRPRMVTTRSKNRPEPAAHASAAVRPANVRTVRTAPKAAVAKKQKPRVKRAATMKKTAAESKAAVAKEEPAPRAHYHLFKSEPESRLCDGIEMKFSIDDLAAEPNATTTWDGVRNYEARNCMQRMRVGDRGFFYHSNSKRTRPGVVGIVEVVREAYPDFTAWDPHDPHYDPKSSEENPKWFMVDVKLVSKLRTCVTLDDIKRDPVCADMALVKRGRISVQDVAPAEWQRILQLAGEAPEAPE